jgi:predicted DNA-binding protein (MmcQ/YjbR family)
MEKKFENNIVRTLQRCGIFVWWKIDLTNVEREREYTSGKYFLPHYHMAKQEEIKITSLEDMSREELIARIRELE